MYKCILNCLIAKLKSSCFRFTVRELRSSELGEALGKEQ